MTAATKNSKKTTRPTTFYNTNLLTYTFDSPENVQSGCLRRIRELIPLSLVTATATFVWVVID